MKRLLDDPQMPAELRDDLKRSRAAAEDYAVAAQLMPLKLALSDASRDPLHGQAAAKAGLSWQVVPTAWKLAVLVALGGAGAVALRPEVRPLPRSAAAVSERAAAARAQRAGLPAAALSQPAVVSQDAPQATAAAAPSQPVLVSQDAPQATAAAAEPTAAAREQRRIEAPRRATARPSGARREIMQLARIRALLDSDPAAAYRLARRSEVEFPGGVLSEERKALAVLALQKSGDVAAAQREGQAFLASFPHSPMRQRVEAALGR